MIAVSNKSRITGNLSGAQNLEDYLVTMPEIRETMEWACAEFEQRICSLKLEEIFLFRVYRNFEPYSI